MGRIVALAIAGFDVLQANKELEIRKHRGSEWAHLDSNQGPTDYEPAALTAELWALTQVTPSLAISLRAAAKKRAL